jgi:catechol 2,3-dioxygenase-like lactoylglutathione lyase family enzyme
MSESMPWFSQLNLAAEDIDAAVAFYRALGMCARYAVVRDLVGNDAGLMSPIDQHRRFTPRSDRDRPWRSIAIRCRRPKGHPLRAGPRSLMVRRGHEDAERVAGRVGVHPEGLLYVVGAVQQESRAKRDGPGVLVVQRLDRRHGEVQVQLLGNVAVGPRGSGEGVHLLEGDARPARAVSQDEPVGAARAGVASGGRFVTGAIAVAE